jgi:hypothetical protein
MRHTPSPRSGFFIVAASVAVLLVWPAAANAQLGGQTSVDPRVLALEIKCNKLQDTINKLEGAVGNLLTLLTCVSRQEGAINGVSGPHLLITGCNVHVRSGSTTTVDASNLGNLIIGYNEPRNGTDTTNRAGSHTLIIGPGHKFTASGGFLAGFQNRVSADFASVSGGAGNIASGAGASVSGGGGNTASGVQASVSGGGQNTVTGESASVSGGQQNMASGLAASVSGGSFNAASFTSASVSGGGSNEASGLAASVSGGHDNKANTTAASVSGGRFNEASGIAASVSGGAENKASGSAASVSGGFSRTASGDNDWAAGSLSQDF